MNNVQRSGDSGSFEAKAERVVADAPSSGEKQASTVWVRHTSTTMAAVLVSRLRGLDLDAKLWDESCAANPGASACDIVVTDRAGLRMMAQCVSRSRAPGGVAPVQPSRGGLAPGVLRRVLAQIECQLAQKIDIADLAAISGLSECHFSRAFRQSVGTPPHRYVMTRRIAVGAGLIERTDRAFTDIALSVGFSDHSHFTRMFVRMTGETPRAYRRRNR